VSVLSTIDLPVRHTRMGPQDIKLAPDGSVFYIADSEQGGVWVIDGAATKVLRVIPTGKGAHGLYLSRDATELYVTNRLDSSVSVLDAYTGAVRTKWTIPGGASPDMGNVTADGTQLWLSGRYSRAVYVLSTTDGHLIRKIDVGDGPQLIGPHWRHPLTKGPHRWAVLPVPEPVPVTTSGSLRAVLGGHCSSPPPRGRRCPGRGAREDRVYQRCAARFAARDAAARSAL